MNASELAIYLHWPFCAAKCPYCDFNSHVAASVDQAAWADAFVSEIGRYGRALPGRAVTSIFFGGGTPSLMEGRTVGRILEAVGRTWQIAAGAEITLEANPGSVEAVRFASYRDAGVNRVSLGVQALDDGDLRRLGRLHSAAEALRAIDTAQSVFERISIDLIYARQDQTAAAWAAELERALRLGLTHLSLYQLTIEPGTVFGRRHEAGRLPGLPDEDLGADLWDITQDLTARAGLPAYEISNHAAPGQESRHNLTYWRSGDWIGIGPGAFGRASLDGERWETEAESAPAAWLAAAQTGGAIERRLRVTEADHAAERVMMGLRTREGVGLDGLDAVASRAAGLLELGVLERRGGRLRLTPRGRPLLNAVLADLL